MYRLIIKAQCDAFGKKSVIDLLYNMSVHFHQADCVRLAQPLLCILSKILQLSYSIRFDSLSPTLFPCIVIIIENI